MLTAITVSLKSGLALAFSVLFAFVNTLTNLGATYVEPPVAPDDFTPVVRFVVCSDVHIDGKDDVQAIRRYTDFIETSYDYAQSQSSYKSLDAICVAGDYTNRGTVDQYEALAAVNNACVREGTQLITVLGNHEFMDNESETYARFAEYIGTPVDSHFVINGFHFVGISYNESRSFFDTEKVSWLNNQLSQAKNDNADYPIFVFQHPHPFGTVYGSVNWGEIVLNSVYSKYPQVINFSGHSHYPINDPRSVWQGSFTALGCGSLKYFELENELFAGQFPEGNENAAQFYIVEADAKGSVQIQGYDLITHSFFDSVDYYIKTPAKKASFAYTYADRMRASNAPMFADDAQVSASKNEAGECVINFPAAHSGDIVHDYKIKVTDSTGIVTYYSQSHLSDYYYQPSPIQYSIAIGTLESRKTYKVSVFAANAYAKVSSPLTAEFDF